jgi:UDP-N-acetylmuramyl pentapeptide synthase
MLELGVGSYDHHRLLGELCGRYKLSFLALVGRYGSALREGALKGGMAESSVGLFSDPHEAIKWAIDNGKGGSWVLIKGSHSTGLSEAFNSLLERTFQ